MVREIDLFAEKLSLYTAEEREIILKAARWAEERHGEQVRASGEPYFIHPLQVAEILVDLRMDHQSVIAALLHDILEDTEVSRLELRKEYGKEVENLVHGVTKISILRAKNKSVQEAETIRKMLFAMVKDVRVILIKLADKLHNMRTLDYLPEEKRKLIAAECLDIYAPLASRLGIGWLKDELEDLAFKHLNRPIYDQIKQSVAEKKAERSEYLNRIASDIYKAAAVEGIEVRVEARAKHFYSIYLKMKKRSKTIDEIFDLYGLRILCNAANDCYTLIGIVHRLWKPIEGRFKDYIAMPKTNKYQSLHTTVMGYSGRLIEIQIRTQDMHRTAEHGIAAHWLYKKGAAGERVRTEDLSIINRLREWNGMHISTDSFLQEIKNELLKDTIYVFTPKGDAIELPKGSTAIDFAYHIHTEVGNHIMAAKADGVIVPLKAELKNTQVIEIVTAANSVPHVNWLRYVKTARARSKIRYWLNKHDEHLVIGRNIVARRTDGARIKVARTAHPPQAGHGREQVSPSGKKTEHAEAIKLLDEKKVGIRIGDERNLLINIAKCCAPATGDEIIGYISRGRGIIVHRRDCSNLAYISDIRERSIHVEWETVSPRPVRHFRVSARRTMDLFSEIEGAVRKRKGHLIAGKIDEDGHDRLLAQFTMELERPEDFKIILKNIRAIPSVLNIYEVSEDSHVYHAIE